MKKYFFLCAILFSFSSHAQQINFNQYYNFGNQYFNCYDFNITSDSCYLLAGYVGGSTGGKYFLMKTDSMGDTLWMRTGIDSLSNTFVGKKIIELENKNYLLFSNRYSSTNRLLVSEYSVTGQLLYESFLFPNNIDIASYSAIKVFNEIYLTAYSSDSNGSHNLLITLDSSFNAVDIDTITDFQPSDISESIIVTSDTLLICAGLAYDSSISQNVSAIAKFDHSHHLQLLKYFADTSSASITSIKSAITHTATASIFRWASTPKIDFVTLDNNLDSVNIYSFQANSLANSIMELSDSSFIVAISYDSSVLVKKISSSSVEIWENEIPNPHQEIKLSGLNSNWRNELILGGWSDDGVQFPHISFLSNLTDSTLFNNIPLVKNKMELDAYLYPNPTNGILNIVLNNEPNKLPLINVNSLLGEEIIGFTTTSEQNLFKTKITFSFDKALPRGIYFILISNEQTTIVKKFILTN